MISAIPLKWYDTGRYGAYGYVGRIEGLEYLRYANICKPGLWRVNLLGWWGVGADAVIDDFGNLVQVGK